MSEALTKTLYFLDKEKEQLSRTFIKVLNWLLLFVSAIMLVTRHQAGDSMDRQWILCLNIFFSSISLLSIKVKNDYRLGKSAILLLFVIGQPYRIYNTGGLWSFGFPWLIVMMASIYWAIGKKAALSTTIIYSIFTLFLYITDGSKNINIKPSNESELIAKTIVLILGFAIMFYLLHLYDATNKKMRKAVSSMEKKSAAEKMINEMAQEINAPLLSASYQLKELEKTHAHLNIEKLKIEHSKIEAYLHRIKTIHDQLND